MPGKTTDDAARRCDDDEFSLDPTRITLLCGTAGFDGNQFKGLLASDYDIQINKTSRNSVLVQININNTRSDIAHLIKALADMARDIDKRLAEGGEAERVAFEARVKSLVTTCPTCRTSAASTTRSATTRRARPPRATCARRSTWPTTPANCEYVKLNRQADRRAPEERPRDGLGQLRDPVSAGLPDPGPRPGGHAETITFMRKLDVKEIHGYNADQGPGALKPEALAAHKGAGKR